MNTMRMTARATEIATSRSSDTGPSPDGGRAGGGAVDGAVASTGSCTGSIRLPSGAPFGLYKTIRLCRYGRVCATSVTRTPASAAMLIADHADAWKGRGRSRRPHPHFGSAERVSETFPAVQRRGVFHRNAGHANRLEPARGV